ncbi:hypothetical protein BD626DRAFT_563938 [Schizophyllum amplum]|uniref:RING-type domain-containing protein n=1 Tax=Schizophyllum amplum TaxID=97359 RepID=A0A550CZQ6_9AGAR|nr:hypothetical protein BD626DRAFT_563938 [Auriculariopsis ampla]
MPTAECSVCLQDVQFPEGWLVLSVCGHGFCEACATWAGGTCHTCRARLGNLPLTRLYNVTLQEDAVVNDADRRNMDDLSERIASLAAIMGEWLPIAEDQRGSGRVVKVRGLQAEPSISAVTTVFDDPAASNKSIIVRRMEAALHEVEKQTRRYMSQTSKLRSRGDEMKEKIAYYKEDMWSHEQNMRVQCCRNRELQRKIDSYERRIMWEMYVAKVAGCLFLLGLAVAGCYFWFRARYLTVSYHNAY